MIYAALVILGLAFGSFVNALVWRLHKQQVNKRAKRSLSITRGRSMCPSCKHELTAPDLIPVLSWIMLKGKCRYCKKPISVQYPLVELSTAGLFILSYVFWPNTISGWEWLQFGVWLACLVGLIALLVYDIRYMLLPNRIIFPLTYLAVFGSLAAAISQNDLSPLVSALYGALIGGGLFYVLFQLSGGSWIGGGDVKLGFMLGILIGGPVPAFIMLFAASLLGTIVSLPFMAMGKLTPKTRIPFGPFLIVGAIVAKLFTEQLISAYTSFLL